MLSRRLQTIASFLEKRDKVVDIGCDHGYLGIYATQKKLVQSIILTDIKESALDMARKNVENSKLNIPLVISDGLENISQDSINTIVISGMGTSTILHILSNKEKLVNVDKLILQSNNNLDTLRKEVTSLGYKLINEATVLDNDIWYVVCLFKKDIDDDIKFSTTDQLDSETIKYGLIKKDKKEYYQYLMANQKEILKKLEKSNNAVLKEKVTKEIKNLEKLLEECRTICTY